MPGECCRINGYWSCIDRLLVLQRKCCLVFCYKIRGADTVISNSYRQFKTNGLNTLVFCCLEQTIAIFLFVRIRITVVRLCPAVIVPAEQQRYQVVAVAKRWIYPQAIFARKASGSQFIVAACLRKRMAFPCAREEAEIYGVHTAH